MILPGLTGRHRATLRIAGQPVPKSSVRVSRGGKHRRYTKATTAYMAEVALRARLYWGKRPPIGGPVCVKVVLILERPKRLCRKKDPLGHMVCGTTMDVDNVCKALFDSLTKAGVWEDDRQVATLLVIKRWASKMDRLDASATVEIWDHV